MRPLPTAQDLDTAAADLLRRIPDAQPAERKALEIQLFALQATRYTMLSARQERMRDGLEDDGLGAFRALTYSAGAVLLVGLAAWWLLS